ncbi:MAG: hypothetical protein KJ709_08965 [Nanoarchaeota archaeon]|nr:hypothetical protein [Nanoarchaeota archaeon]
MAKFKVSKSVRNTVLVVFIAVILTFLFFKLFGSDVESLAKCMSSKGIIMYGQEGCPACIQQKELFKDAFQHLTYVDCRETPDLCAHVEFTPTWEFPDGELLVGKQELKKLADLSGC